MMKEYISTVQFNLEDVSDVEELRQFDEVFGQHLSREVHGEVYGRSYGQEFHMSVEEDSSSGERTLTTGDYEEAPAEVQTYLAGLSGATCLNDWIEKFQGIPEGVAKFRLSVTYHKANDEPRWLYVALTPQGISEVQNRVLQRFENGDQPRSVVVRTPLVSRILSGTNFHLCPLAEPAPAGSEPVSEGLRVPASSDGLSSFLSWIQMAYLWYVVLNRDTSISVTARLEDVLGFSDWLLEHRLRPVIAASIELDVATVDDKALKKLKEDIEGVETSLLQEHVGRLEQTKKDLQAVALDVLRDAHKMRAEVASLMGSELFRILTALAITVAGFAVLEGALTLTGLMVSGTAGLLFLGGAIVKSVANEREFRDLVTLQRHLGSLPLSSNIPGYPDFPRWYRDAVETATRSFYVVLIVGLSFATVPVLVVAALVASAVVPTLNPTVAIAITGAAIAIIVAIALLRKPWKAPLQ